MYFCIMFFGVGSQMMAHLILTLKQTGFVKNQSVHPDRNFSHTKEGNIGKLSSKKIK